jgi:hypothetical protein
MKNMTGRNLKIAPFQFNYRGKFENPEYAEQLLRKLPRGDDPYVAQFKNGRYHGSIVRCYIEDDGADAFDPELKPIYIVDFTRDGKKHDYYKADTLRAARHRLLNASSKRLDEKTEYQKFSISVSGDVLSCAFDFNMEAIREMSQERQSGSNGIGFLQSQHWKIYLNVTSIDMDTGERETGETISFDFFCSRVKPRFENDYDLGNALYCYITDAIAGMMEFGEFCMEFGYNDNADSLNASMGVWSACGEARSKLNGLGLSDDDLYSLANHLSENYG